MSEDLTSKLSDTKLDQGESKPKKFDFASKFNPGASKFTPTFTPGTQTSAPGGQSFGFQDFSNYAQPAQPAAQPSVQPSMDQYQPQADTSLNTRSLNTRALNTRTLNTRTLNVRQGSPKVLSIGKKTEPTEEAKPEAKAEAKAETKPETKPEAKDAVNDVKAEAAPAPASKESSPAPKASSPAPKDVPTPAPKSSKASTAKVAPVDSDAVVKEQEQLDKAVVDDMFGGESLKEHMSILFMGHVDAGKSTMGGNLLYLTGSVDKRTIEKYEREALEAGRQGWYLSWVMDTNKEERNEGKTIEVGRAVFETPKRRYTILDAPGHKMYVPSMIGGASQADAGILVISARAGEYETGFEKGGQTREHAVLAKTQGVDRLVVVVNKMDDPTVNWSKERYDECTSKLATFLKATGYTNVTFMPVSGYTGAGLLEPVPKDLAGWYKGPTLLEWLDSVPLENRKLSAPFMLPVSNKAKDLGTVVEGKIESGAVKKGASLLMMPNRQPVEVSAIYNESEQEIAGAIVGEQVKIKLKGIDEDEIQIGYVLTSAKNPIQAVTRFEAQVALIDIKSIMTAGFSCVMHVHTAVEEVTFTKLLHKLEKGTNRRSKKAPAFAKKGMKIIAELQTTSAICVEEYDKLPQLGRFTLRDQGHTIAIGKVTKIVR